MRFFAVWRKLLVQLVGGHQTDLLALSALLQITCGTLAAAAATTVAGPEIVDSTAHQCAEDAGSQSSNNAEKSRNHDETNDMGQSVMQRAPVAMRRRRRVAMARPRATPSVTPKWHTFDVRLTIVSVDDAIAFPTAAAPESQMTLRFHDPLPDNSQKHAEALEQDALQARGFPVTLIQRQVALGLCGLLEIKPPDSQLSRGTPNHKQRDCLQRRRIALDIQRVEPELEELCIILLRHHRHCCERESHPQRLGRFPIRHATFNSLDVHHGGGLREDLDAVEVQSVIVRSKIKRLRGTLISMTRLKHRPPGQSYHRGFDILLPDDLPIFSDLRERAVVADDVDVHAFGCDGFDRV